MPNYVYNLSSVQLQDSVYRNTTLNSINLSNTPWVNNSMSNAFCNCQNLTSVVNINNNVIDLINTYKNCISLINAPTIPNGVVDMSNTFTNCSNLVNISYIPNNVINLSNTFKSCVNIVYSPVLPNSVINMSNSFNNCSSLLNMPTIPNSVINLSGTFSNCNSLNNTTIIPNSVVDMTSTFMNCTNLTSAPNIPDSVTTLIRTFEGCTNLTTIPSFNSVLNLYETFKNCTNITTVNSIPNSVYSMEGTFDGCINLSDVIEIPDSVETLYRTFANCTNLTNSINIKSYSISNVTNCFNNSSLNKNVYMSYYIPYTNQSETITHSTFINAGYDEIGTLDNVYLNNVTPTVFINTTPSDATVHLLVDEFDIIENTLSVPINSIVNYTISKQNYVTQTNSVTVDEDKHINIELELVKFIFTVTPIPSNSTVRLEASGFTPVEGTGTQSIEIPIGTTVSYIVSRENYITEEDQLVINEDTSITVQLEQIYDFTLDQSDLATLVHYNDTEPDIVVSDIVGGLPCYSLTINTTPSDANVTFDVTGFSLLDEENSIIAREGTEVHYTVTKEGYTTAEDTIIITENTTLNITIYESIDLDDYIYEYTNNELDMGAIDE